MFLAGKLQIDFCWSDLVECFDLLGWSETSNQCFWLGIFYSSWYVGTLGCFFQVWISLTLLVRLLWVWINIVVPDGTGKPDGQNVKSLRILICDFPISSVLFRYVQVFCVFHCVFTYCCDLFWNSYRQRNHAGNRPGLLPGTHFFRLMACQGKEAGWKVSEKGGERGSKTGEKGSKGCQEEKEKEGTQMGESTINQVPDFHQVFIRSSWLALTLKQVC